MKYFADEDVLGQFYKALAAGDENVLQRVHIPRSDVFYVREAIHQKTGVKYSLDRVERAMYLEGHLKKRDVFEPDRKREWE
jgi:hypothetical protein